MSDQIKQLQETETKILDILLELTKEIKEIKKRTCLHENQTPTSSYFICKECGRSVKLF